MDPEIETLEISNLNGNTNSNSKSKQSIQLKNWFFTFNNYRPEEILSLDYQLFCLCSQFCYQEEIGEQSTPHIQGCFTLQQRQRLSSLKLSFEKFPKIHFEPTKNIKAALEYCSKQYTRKPGTLPHTFNYVPKKDIKTIPYDKLYKWQSDIINIIKLEPDERSIYWYWESTGGVGKTSFAKYLSIYYKAIPLEGKKNDILYCAAKHPSDVYIYDIERSLEDYVSYGAIEKIKNGYYMCAKYESEPVIRNCPHVIIFANFEPDYNKLSADRWRVVNIDCGS